MNLALRTSILLLSLLLVLFCVQASSVAGPIMKSEFIFEEAPFPQCHASTIAETSDGLIAAWFGGTREKNADVGIWAARFEKGKWTSPVEVANGLEGTTRYPCWNPVLFRPKTGPLILFYKVGPSPNKWWGMLMQSADSGRTWSPPKRLPDGFLGPIKNKPIKLTNGELLCPSSTEDHGWQIHFERSADIGATWQKTGALNDPKTIGAIQPTILTLGPEHLVALGRTEQHRIFRIESRDGGHHFTQMALTELPNPNSGIDAVTLKDQRHVLVYNHTTSGRSPLNLAISRDALIWDAALVLEDTPGEYSYPAIIQSSDGTVHVTYTWRRKRIKHVAIDPALLTGKPIQNGVWPPMAGN